MTFTVLKPTEMGRVPVRRPAEPTSTALHPTSGAEPRPGTELPTSGAHPAGPRRASG